ncbi:MAG: DUF2752 domain-containing protein [Planctomycetota bacterium]|nr:DUF2752 domain-containing protein [Planctomycetota bacterium]
MQGHEERNESAERRETAEAPRASRWWAGLIAAGCAVVLGVCGWLRPSESGVGTHEQLGGSPCGFLIREGIPCPGCGVTTAMAAGAHGRLALAVKAQVGGLVLLAGVVLLGVAGAAQAATGRPVLRRLTLHRWGWWSLAALAAVLIGWAIKLALGYARGELPLH